MLFLVSWKYENQSRRAFVKAMDEKDAMDIAKNSLRPGCRITGITRAYEHQITPQSITLNFVNTADYYLFG